MHFSRWNTGIHTKEGSIMADKEITHPSQYKVVLNHEEQYSIWPATRTNAPGWRDAGKSGTKSECLEYIDKMWTDMRPLSLRQKMTDNSS